MILPAITQNEQFTPSPIITEPRFVTLFNLDVHRRKNLAALVAVIDRMSQRIPNISLDVYGKGSPKTMFEVSQIVEKSKAKNVRLKGPLPSDGFTTILGDYVGFLDADPPGNFRHGLYRGSVLRLAPAAHQEMGHRRILCR